MKVSFASKRLEKEMATAAAIAKRYGTLAKRLKMRLELLYQAERLGDVPAEPPPRRHQLSEDYAGCYAVDVSGNWRLVFRPNHDPLPLKEDGGVDLTKVTAIEIVEVVDYHKK
ncbi:type II toxin-antitoxin system RelE/ParE family toxin [Xanthobacter autotrophicus]|uniref:type II toxin-antitoxin system RelE/ParE family toxin n=1 Tax=Xanthobacter TaxID=279 RepID=UPI0024AC3D0B|nr:type II toxin-antitoxin system RelE/ParE family toxin [Xanthobacter autotrophicus]MDI4666578.1 type II toxin-antitoxin system RelE/ParE family toxin [Xanthobacter autotrophicus]